MSNGTKWINLVTKLLEATQKNELSWQVLAPPENLQQAGERATHVYEAEYMGRRFRMYEYSFKYWYDDVNYTWSYGLKLEFIDEIGRSLFQVPPVEGLNDLLEAIKYQSADIEKFLQDIGA